MQGPEAIKSCLENMPETSGVYMMTAESGKILYVGKAKNLKKRVANYTALEKNPRRIQMMIAWIATVEIVTTNSESEAFLLEANLIRKHRPRYNILLKDDKSFPYILITGGDFPMLVKHRGQRGKKGDYFGPFASADSVHKTIDTLQKSFLLRVCSDSVFKSRKRPCLEYQIKRCSAPCVGKIGREEYGKLVSQAKDLLSGKENNLQSALAKKMEDASGAMCYEEAAAYRDRIKALSHVRAHQLMSVLGLKDADIIAVFTREGGVCVQVAFYRAGQNYGSKSFFPSNAEDNSPAEIVAAFLPQFYRFNAPPAEIIINHQPEDAAESEEALSQIAGRKVEITVPLRGDKLALVNDIYAKAAEALERKMREETTQKSLYNGLAKKLGLEVVPERIEVFDNSHIMGTNALGGMIVATPEGFAKNSYRKFNIQSEITPGDDYGMLREVLTRRYGRLKKEHPVQEEGVWPDLILIDGGAGHLKTAAEVFADLGINDVTFACIAKGPDRNAGREIFHMPGKTPFSLEKNDPVLYLLQRLRDEAHRFAIEGHRARRAKAITKSELDEIEGIGTKRKRALLNYFGSVKAIKDAMIEDLLKVEGIDKKTAQVIFAGLHG